MTRCSLPRPATRCVRGIVLFAVLAGCWAVAQAASAAAPPATLTLALSSSSIPANGQSQTTATAIVADSMGASLPGETVTIAATGGAPVTVGPPSTCTTTTDANGNAYCTVQITSSTTIGSTTIQASDPNLPGQTPSQTLNQTAGPPAVITLTVSPSSIVAGGSGATATATVTDSVGHLLSGEPVDFAYSGTHVSFSNNGTCPTSGSGTCSVTITGTVAGSTTITATDSNIDPSIPGTQQSTSQPLTVSAGAPAHVSLALNPPTILADGLSSTSATATVTDAFNNAVLNANVSFSSTDPGQFVGGVTNNNDGTYSAQIRGSRTVGSSSITAQAGSATSPPATLIQAAGPSSTSLVASTASLLTNQAVTLVATVSGDTGSPAGTITFQNAGIAIPGCAGDPISPSSTVATCQTSFAASGSPALITAVFVPGVGSTAPGSTSASLDLPVARDSTSVLLQTPPSATAGRPITYTATVTPPSSRPGPIEPAGTTQFFDNGQPISSCASAPLVNSVATCVVMYKRAGPHTITATYGGDANFSGSTSSAAGFTVAAPQRRVIGVRGSLGETMQWNFYFRFAYTRVVLLVVHGAAAGDTLVVTCRGNGCPFTRHVSKLKQRKQCSRRHGKRTCSSRGHYDLTLPLQGRRLRAGAKITVLITRPNWIGKYYAFSMRAGRGPVIKVSCLTPGYSKPGVGCPG